MYTNLLLVKDLYYVIISKRVFDFSALIALNEHFKHSIKFLNMRYTSLRHLYSVDKVRLTFFFKWHQTVSNFAQIYVRQCMNVMFKVYFYQSVHKRVYDSV